MSKLVLVVFLLVVVFASVGWGVEDPELEQCKIQCGKQRQYDKEQIQDCRDKCDRYYWEKQRREREEEKGPRIEDSNPEDPFRRLAECQGRCARHQDEKQQRDCQQKCFEQYRKETERQEKGPRIEDSNPEDPFRRLAKCEGRCAQHQDEKQQRDCQQKCFERYQKETERQEKGPRIEDSNPEDPFKRLAECQGRCGQHEDEKQQRECQQKCFEQYQKETERQEKGPRIEDSNPEDPFRRLAECQGRCAQHHDEKQQREYQQKCFEWYQKETERQEKGPRIEDSNPEDPFRRLAECQGRCGQHEDEQQRRACQQKCFKQYQKETERHEREGQHGGGVVYLNPREDPFKKRRECEGKCVQKRDEHERRECHDRCQEEFRREQEREEQEQEREHGRVGRGENPKRGEEEREEQQEKWQDGEPYVFHDKHFSAPLQSDHGRISILQRFTERSDLLRGIDNFRVAIFEANPHTLVVPNHWDADTICFVHQGRGIVSLVRQDKRESINIRRGDIFRVWAGTTVYIVNRDNSEKLLMAYLVHPVSTPGKFEAFFGPGGKNPESFFRAFSTELLEAAFNAKRDRFERVFNQQRQGPIIKASEEQIRGMSHHGEGRIWPFGGESKGSFNLFEQRPSQSNQYGKFYEVDANEFRGLEDLDVGVSFANISKGSMTAPMFNSRATKIAVIVNGEGYLEIACPHVSSSSESKQKGRKGGGSGSQRQFVPRYQRVSANLRRGSVFVVPAGHPFITVASQNDNLQVVGFEVKAENNEKIQLAGRKNIFGHLEREAKELAFGVSKREVDEVLKSQDDEFFLKGPHQQHEGRAYA